MSDCGACIDSFDGESPDVFTAKTVKARKPHRCTECGDTIPVGAMHEYVSGRWDGEWGTFRTCSTCIEIRTMATCGHGSFTLGMVWEDITEQIFPEGTLAGCLSRLTSVAARQKLAEKWREWKGLPA